MPGKGPLSLKYRTLVLWHTFFKFLDSGTFKRLQSLPREICANNPWMYPSLPHSIMNILLLVSLGSNGRTRDEIRSVLKFPLYFPPEHDHLMMKCALQRYDGVSVHTANAWVSLRLPGWMPHAIIPHWDWPIYTVRMWYRAVWHSAANHLNTT